MLGSSGEQPFEGLIGDQSSQSRFGRRPGGDDRISVCLMIALLSLQWSEGEGAVNVFIQLSLVSHCVSFWQLRAVVVKVIGSSRTGN